MAICKTCGSNIAEGSQFCTRCGSSVGSETESAPQKNPAATSASIVYQNGGGSDYSRMNVARSITSATHFSVAALIFAILNWHILALIFGILGLGKANTKSEHTYPELAGLETSARVRCIVAIVLTGVFFILFIGILILFGGLFGDIPDLIEEIFYLIEDVLYDIF